VRYFEVLAAHQGLRKERFGNGSAAAVDTEFAVDVLEVFFNGATADAECVGNLGAG